MRSGIILAAALSAVWATSADAQEWCGYAAHPKALIQCGYSTVADCESTIGKGAMCFVDPDYALNARHATPVHLSKLAASPG